MLLITNTEGMALWSHFISPASAEVKGGVCPQARYRADVRRGSAATLAQVTSPATGVFAGTAMGSDAWSPPLT